MITFKSNLNKKIEAKKNKKIEAKKIKKNKKIEAKKIKKNKKIETKKNKKIKKKLFIKMTEKKDNQLNPKKSTCVTYMGENYTKYQGLFDIIFDQTLYYTKNDITKMLKNSITDWKTNRTDRPLKVLLPNKGSGPPGSREYYYALFKNDLPKHEIVYQYTKYKEEVEYLYLDDWFMNGTALFNEFDDLGFTDAENFFLNYQGDKYKAPKITFMSGLSLYKKDELTNILKISNIVIDLKMSVDVYDLKTCIDLPQFANNKDSNLSLIDEFNNEFGVSGNLGLAYLDYKFPNEDFSYSGIYSNCANTSFDKFVNKAGAIAGKAQVVAGNVANRVGVAAGEAYTAAGVSAGEAAKAAVVAAKEAANKAGVAAGEAANKAGVAAKEAANKAGVAAGEAAKAAGIAAGEAYKAAGVAAGEAYNAAGDAVKDASDKAKFAANKAMVDAGVSSGNMTAKAKNIFNRVFGSSPKTIKA